MIHKARRLVSHHFRSAISAGRPGSPLRTLFGAAAFVLEIADRVKNISYFGWLGTYMTYASRLGAMLFGLAVTAGIPAWAAPETTGRPVEHQLNMQLPVTGV